MTAPVGVRRGVAGGRAVAAAHVTALQADAEVKPGRSRGETVDAAVDGVGELRDSDVVQVRAGCAHATTIRLRRRRWAQTTCGTRGCSPHAAGEVAHHHCARTASAHVPMFATNCATQSARKMGLWNGAEAEGADLGCGH